MRNIRTFFLLAALASAATAPAVATATEVLPHLSCPNCTVATMRTRALQVLPNAIGVYSLYVYSLPTKTIKRYQVECITTNVVDPATGKSASNADRAPVSTGLFDSSGNHIKAAACSGSRLLTEISVAADKLAYFNALVTVYNRTGGTMKDSVAVSVMNMPMFDNRRPTVYDLARDGGFRDAYATHSLAAARQVNLGLNVLVENAMAWLGFSDGTTVVITVITADGGSVTYEWKPPATEPTYVPGSARTAGNQRVPDSPAYREPRTWLPQGTNGNFDDLREFADHLRRLGIPVYRGDTIVPVGTVIPGPIARVTCEQMPDGRFLCKIEVLP